MNRVVGYTIRRHEPPTNLPPVYACAECVETGKVQVYCLVRIFWEGEELVQPLVNIRCIGCDVQAFLWSPR